MAVPTIYSWPTLDIQVTQNKFFIARRFLQFGNPWTAHSRIGGTTDERWACEMTFVVQDEDEWNEIEAFIDKIDGAGGFVYLHDPAHVNPRGSTTGNYPSDTTAAVKTAAPRGSTTITLKELGVSATNALRKNDFFSIVHAASGVSLLYKCVDDITTDANGEAAVTIRPRLRAPVAANDVVQFLRPKSPFRLVEDNNGAVQRRYPVLGDVVLQFIETPEIVDY